MWIIHVNDPHSHNKKISFRTCLWQSRKTSTLIVNKYSMFSIYLFQQNATGEHKNGMESAVFQETNVQAKEWCGMANYACVKVSNVGLSGKYMLLCNGISITWRTNTLSRPLPRKVPFFVTNLAFKGLNKFVYEYMYHQMNIYTKHSTQEKSTVCQKLW